MSNVLQSDAFEMLQNAELLKQQISEHLQLFKVKKELRENNHCAHAELVHANIMLYEVIESLTRYDVYTGEDLNGPVF